MFGKSNITNDENRIRKYDYSVRVAGICLLLFVILAAMSQCTHKETKVESLNVVEDIIVEEIVLGHLEPELP